jgi:hypothetical protein
MKSSILLHLFFVLIPTCLFSQTTVTTQGRNILVNGSVYKIHGVCYNPVAIGSNSSTPLDFSHIDQDIQLMKDANINTIRTYIPITNTGVLDKFATAGIKVIIGFPNYNTSYPDIYHKTYLNYINTYKNHSAILMWELGNEYNYHPEWFTNDINNWYKILNEAATAIHTADPKHPVSTAHGEVPASNVLGLCPAVDVWGMNVYRWDNPSGAITSFAAASAKPCYLSEAGGDRYNNTQGIENQQNQATADLNTWNSIKGKLDQCAGITFFAFVDEWWKSGNGSIHDASGFVNSIPYDNFANEEWWGIVDIYRNTTLAYDALKTAFTDFTTGTSDLAEFQKSILYPNPATTKTIVRLPKPVNENVELHISTLTGYLLVSDKITVSGSEIEIALKKYNLANGSYLVVVKGKSLIINTLLIKQ